MNFSDLGLSEKTIQAIDEFGIKEPTTVQTDVIPSILQGKDVFTIAPAGCGKTMSYVFPLIDIISSNNSDKDSRGKNILIVTPDSAQSVKVSDRLAVFNKYHEINEATIKDRDEDVDNEANVIIGSPDLLLDVVEHLFRLLDHELLSLLRPEDCFRALYLAGFRELAVEFLHGSGVAEYIFWPHKLRAEFEF